MEERMPTKIRYRLRLSGEIDTRDFKEALVEEANRLKVSGVIRGLADRKVEVIFEGEKEAINELFIWLLAEPRLPKISRLESDTEEFLNEFEGKEFQIL